MSIAITRLTAPDEKELDTGGKGWAAGHEVVNDQRKLLDDQREGVHLWQKKTAEQHEYHQRYSRDGLKGF